MKINEISAATPVTASDMTRQQWVQSMRERYPNVQFKPTKFGFIYAEVPTGEQSLLSGAKTKKVGTYSIFPRDEYLARRAAALRK